MSQPTNKPNTYNNDNDNVQYILLRVSWHADSTSIKHTQDRTFFALTVTHAKLVCRQTRASHQNPSDDYTFSLYPCKFMTVRETGEEEKQENSTCFPRWQSKR